MSFSQFADKYIDADVLYAALANVCGPQVKFKSLLERSYCAKSFALAANTADDLWYELVMLERYPSLSCIEWRNINPAAFEDTERDIRIVNGQALCALAEYHPLQHHLREVVIDVVSNAPNAIPPLRL